jgi:hypothetical protein
MDENEKEIREDVWQALNFKVDCIRRGAASRTQPESLGLCAKCNHVHIRKTSFGKIDARCGFDVSLQNHMSIRPSLNDPIKECANFYPIGQPSLWDMSKIATLIESESNKKAGF